MIGALSLTTFSTDLSRSYAQDELDIQLLQQPRAEDIEDLLKTTELVDWATKLSLSLQSNMWLINHRREEITAVLDCQTNSLPTYEEKLPKEMYEAFTKQLAELISLMKK